MYVVTVLFEVVAAHQSAFQTAIRANAAESLSNEPGCRRFDVCFSEDGRRCFLYEMYDDQAAFEFHLGTPHFAAFDELSRLMYTGKRIETYLLQG